MLPSPLLQVPSKSSSSILDVTQWFTILSEQATMAVVTTAVDRPHQEKSTNTTTTTNTNTTNMAWKDLYDYVIQWEERASSSSSSSSSFNTKHTNVLYSVNDWMEYLERIDDMIITLRLKTSSSSSSSLLPLVRQVRDWVGRRAISYLPRSYKLWKSIWEFQLQSFQQQQLLLQQQQGDSRKNTNNSSNSSHHDVIIVAVATAARSVMQCFEQAVRTLSNYPRVWMVYLQFLWQHPIPVAIVLRYHDAVLKLSSSTTTNSGNNDYHTHVRRVLNRALQSLPVTQHEKIWSLSGIIDFCLNQSPLPQQEDIHENDNKNEKEKVDGENTLNETTSHAFWPFPTLNRILCRYSQFLSATGNSTTTDGTRSSSFPMEYATWCETHQQYASAAAAYVAILNSYNHNSTTTTTEGTSDSILVVGHTSNNTHHLSQQIQHSERDLVFQSLMELMAQHADTLHHGNIAGASCIPWETIVQTTIQNEIELQQQQQQSNTDAKSIASRPSSSRFLGMLYTWYASAYIQRGEYDMARSIYEEGLLHVMTVRDFTILYTSYLSFLEGLIQVLYDNNNSDDEGHDDTNENRDVDDNENNSRDDWDLLLLDQNNHSSNNMDDMEMAMLRAEYLIQRRALLLNAVKLRQNPNDCAAYLERCELFMNQPNHDNQDGRVNEPREQQQQQVRPAITTLQDGLHRITNGGSNSSDEKGSTTAATTISDLVLRLVQIYEETLHDIDAARNVFHSVCVQRTMALGIVNADELAICWTKYIEFELKHEQYDTALSLSRQSISSNPLSTRKKRNNIAATATSLSGSSSNASVRSLNLTKSLRLWDLLLDLEESLGTVQTTKDAYNRAIEIKAATVHHILNFASYLMEHLYYEESYSAYERGIELFAYPHPGAKLLWKAYIDAFIKRYKGTKVERVRNLFSRCLEHCPSSDCAEFFMIHGQYEEEYGLSKRALSVYKEMCEKLPVEDMYTAYQIFIAKTIKHRNVPATREIYQDAIEKLAKVHPTSVVKMCEDFAQMEVGLNQIDRARAIYVYGAQSADPRRTPEYWKGWNDFEIEHGNEDTFRDMLRVKRSVEAAFSTINYNAIGMTQTVSTFTNEEAMSMIAAAEGMDYNDMNNSLTTGTAVAGFVPASATSTATNKRSITTLDDVEERVAQLRKVTGVTESDNPNVPPPPTTTAANPTYADDDEIDLDEIDAEIEAAAADGANGM